MKPTLRCYLLYLCISFCGVILAAEKNESDTEAYNRNLANQVWPALMEELSGCVIPDFTINEVDAKGALDRLFALAEGKLKYVKGYKMGAGESPQRLSLSLKNVEFGVALNYIAENFSLRMREANGLLTFGPVEWKERSIRAIPVKDATARKLNIGQTTAADSGAKEALERIGIDCHKAAYSVTRKLLVIEANEGHLERLAVLINLMENGYEIKFSPPTNK